MDLIKKISLVLMFAFMLAVFAREMTWLEQREPTRAGAYFAERGLEETGSANIVTGIYLDYRLFDSIFETGLLLMTVSGITFMSRKGEKP